MGDCKGDLPRAVRKSYGTCNNPSIQLLHQSHQHHSQQHLFYLSYHLHSHPHITDYLHHTNTNTSNHHLYHQFHTHHLPQTITLQKDKKICLHHLHSLPRNQLNNPHHHFCTHNLSQTIKSQKD